MTTARRYMQRTDDPHPILADITRFLQATGMSDAAFGSRALGDPCFVEDVRCGRDVRRVTERRVRAYIDGTEPVVPTLYRGKTPA